MFYRMDASQSPNKSGESNGVLCIQEGKQPSGQERFLNGLTGPFPLSAILVASESLG